MVRINEKLAKIFKDMSEIYLIKNVQWKPQAYRNAAETLGTVEDLTKIYVKSGSKGLMDIPGIGPGICKKIVQFIETGHIGEYDILRKSIPGGILEMMEIPGVGPKKAQQFFEKGIKNVKELKKIIKKGELKNISGFNTKSTKKVIEGIKILKTKIKGRILYQDALIISQKIIKQLKSLKIQKIEVAGSLRRRKKTIKDIDIIILGTGLFEKIVKLDFVAKVLGKGKKKVSVISKEGIEVDIRFTDKVSYGARLLYFTGDKGHNIMMRKVAIKKGLKLSEYGLFKGKVRIAGKTEKEIYSKLGIKYVKPVDRIG